MTAARPRRGGAPIGLQFVALLLTCLVAAQAVSFGVILLMPPPRPPLYRSAEIATALRGGPLTAKLGRPMQRTTTRELPADLREAPAGHPGAQALAAALRLPATDVRLAQRAPPGLARWRRARAMSAGFGEGPRSGLVLMRERGLGAEGPPGRPGVDMIVSDFAAAVRRPDGAWTIVRSAPEPFPNAWQRRSLLLLLGGFLVVAPAGYLFARRITAPLKRFSEAAERLGRDPHAPQMTLTGPAEIGAAAHAFNDMQGRLKRYIDDRTRMVGAISHDLRTPLARIRFKMEAAPPVLRDSVIDDVRQMETMIAGVLAFIRNESQPRRRERLDLLSLVECVADDAALLGADVEVVDGRAVAVEGDSVALQRLFANLVDNAVKYGGQARIQVRQEDGSAIVSIADRGAGLTADELSRVFEPFYRTDASRNLDTAGVGLGLPIARTTARAHGGDVELASAPGGTTALVTLPVAP